MSSFLQILYNGDTVSQVGIFDRIYELFFAPLTFSLVSSAFPPYICEYTVYMYTVCKGGGVCGHRKGGGLRQIKHLPLLSPFTDQIF
jgi:hypothetical protein